MTDDLMVNAVQKRAMDVVIEYEKQQGKNPVDVSKEGKGYDIDSDGVRIEVKGNGGYLTFVLFNSYNMDALEKARKDKTPFKLYIIFGKLDTAPQLLILDDSEVKNKAKPDKIKRECYDGRTTECDTPIKQPSLWTIPFLPAVLQHALPWPEQVAGSMLQTPHGFVHLRQSRLGFDCNVEVRATARTAASAVRAEPISTSRAHDSYNLNLKLLVGRCF